MKEKIKEITPIVILIILTYLICLVSHTNPLSKVGTGIDSSVFTYVANRINVGEMPYRDWFDHKGPIIYILNWIGTNIQIANINGVWIIEYISIFITIIFTQKILKKVFRLKNIESIILNCLININTIFFIEGGNLVELYALPIITIALYLMLTLDKQNIKRNNFGIGILLGVITGLRVNMIALWIIYYIFAIVKCVKDKKIKEIANILIFSFLGFLCTIGILVIYLIQKGALLECIRDYILFNFKYASTSDESLLKVIKYFILSTNFLIYIIILIGGVFIRNKIKLSKFSLAFSIITWIILLQPQRPYLHYGMILIPTFIIPIASIYKYIKEKNTSNIIKGCILVLLIMLLLIIPTKYYIKEYKNINITERIGTEKEELTKYIVETTEEKDKILVLGNDCEIYLLTNRVSASKYEYQSPIYKINPDILKETVKDIKNNKPIYIIVLKYQNGEDIENKILSEINKDYEMIKEMNQFKIYLINQ